MAMKYHRFWAHRQVALILESGEPFEVAHHVPWTIIGRKKKMVALPFGERVDDFFLGETGFRKWCLFISSLKKPDIWRNDSGRLASSLVDAKEAFFADVIHVPTFT